MADRAVRKLIDFSQPAAVLLVAVLHFLADTDDPWRLVATLRDALAPGSYLVISHGTDENDPARARAAEKLYNRSVSAQAHARSRAAIGGFFAGFELVDPGLVYVPLWRPDSPAAVPEDPGRYANLAGVARKN